VSKQEFNVDHSDFEPTREARWKVALKWIGLLPGSIVAYFIAGILNDWAISRAYDGEMIHDMMGTGGFAGHYIMGPIYLFHHLVVPAAVFSMFAIRFAPSHKNVVFGVNIGMYVLWILTLIFILGAAFNEFGGFRWEPLIRMIIEILAAGCGIVFGGRYMLEEVANNRGFPSLT
jgi:hypothetical protein